MFELLAWGQGGEPSREYIRGRMYTSLLALKIHRANKSTEQKAAKTKNEKHHIQHILGISCGLKKNQTAAYGRLSRESRCLVAGNPLDPIRESNASKPEPVMLSFFDSWVLTSEWGPE